MVYNYRQVASRDSLVLKEIDNNIGNFLVVHAHNTLFVTFDSNKFSWYLLQLQKHAYTSGWISQQQNWKLFLIYSARVLEHCRAFTKTETFLLSSLSH